LTVYNTAGEKVKTLWNERYQDAQEVKVTWDGTNEKGEMVANGLYLIHFEGSLRADTKKILVLR
jgi:flagellar hook assembly protein FlgD